MSTPDEWISSLGTPVGITVIPSNFLPDGKARIMFPSIVSLQTGCTWCASDEYLPTRINSYERIVTTDNNTGYTTYSSGYLPSDTITNGLISNIDSKTQYNQYNTKYVPSPYYEEIFNTTSYTPTFSGYTNALSDMDGSLNTNNLISLSNSFGAVNYAISPYNTYDLDWYLPSIGELCFIAVRKNIISQSLSKIGKAQFLEYLFWSSTLKTHSRPTIWCLSFKDYMISAVGSISTLAVLSLAQI